MLVVVVGVACALRSSSPRRRRRPPPRPQQREKEDVAQVCRTLAGNEAAPPIVVPDASRGRPAPPISFAYASLDSLVPGLGAAFENYEFRDALRMAARADLCAGPLARDRASSVQGSWHAHHLDALDAALENLGISGRDLLRGLAGLRLPGLDARPVAGHFMDIVGIRDRRLAHSWHQDAHGKTSQLTIMLGFPARDFHSTTTGVFSHVVKLSHELQPRTPRVAPLDFVDFPVSEANIIRPHFCRGQEILVYSDAATLHSAPDLAHRDSIWRLM